MVGYMSLEEQVDKDFSLARRRALLRMGCCASKLEIDCGMGDNEVRRRPPQASEGLEECQLGTQEVSLCAKETVRHKQKKENDEHHASVRWRSVYVRHLRNSSKPTLIRSMLNSCSRLWCA